MNERPIIMSTDSVNAILQGYKTQTRRVIVPQPWFRPEAYDCVGGWLWSQDGSGDDTAWWGTKCPMADVSALMRPYCPYAKESGDRLWVRERWLPTADGKRVADYQATAYGKKYISPWKSAMMMPRWASRITLEVIRISVEQLQDITWTDCKAEGTPSYTAAYGILADDPPDARWKYIETWDRLNAKRGYTWESNPWVWVIEFRRVKP